MYFLLYIQCILNLPYIFSIFIYPIKILFSYITSNFCHFFVIWANFSITIQPILTIFHSISPWTVFELTTFVMIGTVYTGSCKSNYHTIMTMTALWGQGQVTLAKNPIFLYNFKFLSFFCDLGQFFHYHTTYSHYISFLHWSWRVHVSQASVTWPWPHRAFKATLNNISVI
jgi:hypothetical protein